MSSTKRAAPWIGRLLMFYWLSQLLSVCDGTHYAIPYLLAGLPAALCELLYALSPRVCACAPRERSLAAAFSALFSAMIALANYALWDFTSYAGTALYIPYMLYQLVFMAAFLCGGFLVFMRLFTFLAARMERFLWPPAQRSTPPVRAFLLCFFCIALINLTLLFACMYPGAISTDSISQISQIQTGLYSNHHPYYHTMAIRLCVGIGRRLFGTVNAGIALYSAAQVLFMAACFAFCVSTMARMRLPRPALIVTGAFYALAPYHILYSMTVWKDVPFAGCVLLFVLAFFRALRSLGPRRLNFALAAVSGVGMCLLRSNGFIAFLMMALLALVLFGRRQARMLLLFALVAAFSFMLKHPVLNALGIAQPDFVESLSIPVQQVARVIVEEGEITGEERALLSKVVDVDAVPQVYTDFFADPIKMLVRDGDQAYLAEHKGEFLRLYLSVGLRNPGAYLRAWVDQTCGYWDGGYNFWRWYARVQPNSLGIERVTHVPVLFSLLGAYLDAFTAVQPLVPLLCIGLFVWLHIAALYAALVRRDRAGIFCAAPVLAIVLTLVIATPVFAEFRYIYAAFCTLPFVLAVALRPSVDA